MNDKTRFASLAISIPTYKRPWLLDQLLTDLSHQSCHPDILIIVDGEPASGDVLTVLRNHERQVPWTIVYVPSNHPNLPYQRYLGWRVAKQHNCEILLYLDDDLRIPQSRAIELLITPLAWDSKGIVGVTCPIRQDFNTPIGKEIRHHQYQGKNGESPFLVRWFGNSRKLAPGELTPVGQRRAPSNRGHAYEPVDWLRGGVMTFKMDALRQNSFADSVFAMAELGWGKGEDLILSRCVSFNGKYMYANNVVVEHPNADVPKAYSADAYPLGYGDAYSRRLVNDMYRGNSKPSFSDRMALMKTYIGTTALYFCGVLRRPSWYQLAYTTGYLVGAFRGLMQSPTAKRLTPHIRWWEDADMALERVYELPCDFERCQT